MLHHGDSLDWLRGLPDGVAALCVADPPYHIAKAAWDRFPSDADYLRWSRAWVEQVRRVLRPDGSLYVMGFSEILADVKAEVRDLFPGCRWLVWHYRNKANLRDDWGRSHESILHLRMPGWRRLDVDPVREPYNAHTERYPARPQGATSQFGDGGRGWQPHPLGARPRDVLTIPILNNGMPEKTAHPTQKPLELIRRLVASSSAPGDLVIDPFLGSGTTAVACALLGRRWAGCEGEADYLPLIEARLADVAAGRLSLDDLRAGEAKMRRNRAKVRG